MTRTPERRGRRWIASVLVLAAMGAAVAAAWFTYPRRRHEPNLDGIERVAVHRTDLHLTLRAGGLIESSKRTMIQCELESLQYSNEGRTLGAGGRTTILELVPDGSTVKRDDVLCRLDSSDYEELVRQQEIKVQQSRNDHLKAELDVKAAETALVEYRDGLLPDEIQTLDGQILMAESEVRRQSDRLAWSAKMMKNGYQSQSQYKSEQQRQLAAEVNLERARGQRSLLRDYQAPTALRNLEFKLANVKSQLAYQDVRLRRNESLLARFRKQVERCTVRAPHDGFVIYATTIQRGPVPVEVGAQVHQKMNLFYLPDLSRMEVQAVLNESVIDRVHAKQSARVQVEGLPQYQLEGDVVAIDPLPIVGRDLAAFSDVKNYLGRIRLRNVPKGLLPGMTAQVEIQTATAPNALVIPSESLVVENGKDYCYVAHPDGLERREVRIGQGTRDLLEIRSGLEEGEEVVRDPSRLDESEIELATTHPSGPHEPGSENEPTAPSAH